MSSLDTRAASRYASALFQFCVSENCVEEVSANLATVKDLMAQSPLFHTMWYSPLIPSGRKRVVIGKLLEGKVHVATLAFLRLLIDKRREESLDAIPVELHILIDKAANRMRALATFAVEPTDDEVAGIVASLKQRTGKDVTVTVKVDKAILGGVLVRLDDLVLDGSIRGSLEKIREHMLVDG